MMEGTLQIVADDFAYRQIGSHVRTVGRRRSRHAILASVENDLPVAEIHALELTPGQIAREPHCIPATVVAVQGTPERTG
jgi:hypothetical protein